MRLVDDQPVRPPAARAQLLEARQQRGEPGGGEAAGDDGAPGWSRARRQQQRPGDRGDRGRGGIGGNEPDETRADPLFYSTPVSKAAFLGGRFTGTLIVNAIVTTGVGLGAWAATISPWVKADKIAPFSAIMS